MPNPSLKLTIAVKSDVGRVRAVNEDSVLAYIPESGSADAFYGSMFVVSDGIGSLGHGDLASQVVIDALRASYYDPDLKETDIQRRIRRALMSVNDAVRSRASIEGIASMGATVAGIVIFPKRGSAVIFNVGDSHVYRRRSKQSPRQLSQEDVRFKDEGGQEPLTQYMGQPHPLVPHAYSIDDLQLGDSFIVCTDGLWKVVTLAEMFAVVEADLRDATKGADKLIQLVLERGAPDNVSLAVISLLPTRRAIRNLLVAALVMFLVLIFVGAALFIVPRFPSAANVSPTESTNIAVLVTSTPAIVVQFESATPNFSQTAEQRLVEAAATETAQQVELANTQIVSTATAAVRLQALTLTANQEQRNALEQSSTASISTANAISTLNEQDTATVNSQTLLIAATDAAQQTATMAGENTRVSNDALIQMETENANNIRATETAFADMSLTQQAQTAAAQATAVFLSTQQIARTETAVAQTAAAEITRIQNVFNTTSTALALVTATQIVIDRSATIGARTILTQDALNLESQVTGTAVYFANETQFAFEMEAVLTAAAQTIAVGLTQTQDTVQSQLVQTEVAQARAQLAYDLETMTALNAPTVTPTSDPIVVSTPTDAATGPITEATETSAPEASTEASAEPEATDETPSVSDFNQMYSYALDGGVVLDTSQIVIVYDRTQSIVVAERRLESETGIRLVNSDSCQLPDHEGRYLQVVLLDADLLFEEHEADNIRLCLDETALNQSHPVPAYFISRNTILYSQPNDNESNVLRGLERNVRGRILDMTTIRGTVWYRIEFERNNGVMLEGWLINDSSFLVRNADIIPELGTE